MALEHVQLLPQPFALLLIVLLIPTQTADHSLDKAMSNNNLIIINR